MLHRVSVVVRSASLLLGPSSPAGDLDGTVRQKYRHPAEVEAHRREALAGPTPSQHKFLSEHLKPESTVLDVGSAAGRITFGTCRLGHRVVAIDSADAMIAEAVGLSRRLGLSARFAVMDARTLAFPAAGFDAVLMLGSILSYIPRREGRLLALREACRVLKPGGRILIETQSRESTALYRAFFSLMACAQGLLRSLGRPSAWEVGDRLGITVSAARSGRSVYFHMYAPSELARDLEDAGFEPRAVETSLYLMYYVGLKR